MFGLDNLSTILLIIITVIIAAQAAWTVAQKRGGMPSDWAAIIDDIGTVARVSVAAAKQYKDKTNVEKKQYVEKVISDFVEARGVPIPKTLTDAAIESAVYWLNYNVPEKSPKNSTDGS
jgi:hypothetical protein